MQIQSYPHITMNVEDQSIFIPTPSQQLPLFRPLYFLKAERGPVARVIWSPDYNDAADTFGEKTFDPTSEYYSREAEYLRQTFQHTGAFIVRLAPDSDDDTSAKESVVVLEAMVNENADLPQYQTDAEGNYVYNEDGDPIVVGSVNGMDITWTVRPLEPSEEPDQLEVRANVLGSEYTAYPMMVFHMPYPGVYGNNQGFALFYEEDENDPDQYSRVGAPFFSFAPVEYENGVTKAVRDSFNMTKNSFIMKPDTVDPATLAPVSMDDVIQRAYQGRLPYRITAYNSNFQTIGEKLIQMEQGDWVEWIFASDADTYTTSGTASAGSTQIELVDASGVELDMAVAGSGVPYGATVTDINGNIITINLELESDVTDGTELTIDYAQNSQPEFDYDDGYQINILTGVNPETNVSYQRLNVSYQNDGLLSTLGSKYAVMKPIKDVYYKLRNGRDGKFQEGGFEAKLRAFLEGTLRNQFGEGELLSLEDPSRFPFNYLFDVGYSLETKQALIDFQGVRDDVRSSIGCYIPGEANDKITNISTGMGLREYALLQMESVLKGTQGCRTSIWAQSGKLAGSTDETWYPATLWDAVVHAEFQNRQFLDRLPQGLPNSIVDIFREWNWIPTTEDTKRRFWNEGINYAQYYNMTGVHFPAVRTVYDYETSVLINNSFVDAIVYAKQALRYIWHKYTGTTMPFTELADRVQQDCNAVIQKIFNEKYAFNVNVYRTDFERKLGYVVHIDLNITAPGTTRVFRVDIIANRENFEG